MEKPIRNCNDVSDGKLIGLSFEIRKTLLSAQPKPHLNLVCKSAFYRSKLAIYKCKSHLSGGLQQCKSSIYYSVNGQFTVNERPLDAVGNLSG